MLIIQELFRIFTCNLNTIWGTCGPISVPKENQIASYSTVISTDVHTCSPPTQTLFSLLLHLDIYLYIYSSKPVYKGQMKILQLTDIIKLFLPQIYTLNY